MSLGNWGQSWQRWLNELFTVPYVRDFTHSAKIFRENSYELSPKQKFLFHTYFDINPNAVQNPINVRPIGLLVRDVKLPSYKFDVKEYNQYNRKRLVQTKINYDPVSITFHDDTAGIMTEMWHAYYTYYYADGRKPNSGLGAGARGRLTNLINGGPVVDIGTLGTLPIQNVQQRTQYRNINPGEGDWGYIGENFRPEPDPTKIPFFNKITIFGFAQHNFIAYTLINPIITEFAHDNYNYDEGSGTMRNTMTVNYETVVYNQGSIDGRDPGAIAVGFGQEGYYDRTNSPLTAFGYNGLILGRNGLLSGINNNILQPLLSGDPLLALINAGIAGIRYRNTNLKEQANAEINKEAQENVKQIVSGNVTNGNRPVYIPMRGAAPSTIGKPSQPDWGLNENPSDIVDISFGLVEPNLQPTVENNKVGVQIAVAGTQYPSGRAVGGVKLPTLR